MVITLAPVFPSEEESVTVLRPHDEYGGAHGYMFKECLGFVDGETKYADSNAFIYFVEKRADGTTAPGLQSEQLVIALIDRHEKLDAKFPSPHNQKAIAGLRQFLEASRERVEERVLRGVMGDLKK